MGRNLPTEIVKKLYLSYIHPTMEYASLVWHASIREEEATALERIQASVARAILRAPWRTPKSHLLEQLDWPSPRCRRTVATLVFLHKLMYSVSSPCADSLMPFSASKSWRALRKLHQILLSQPNKSCYRNSFFFYAAALRNTLPDNIQSQKSRKQFKKAVKFYLKSYKYITNKNVPLPHLC